MRQVQILFLSLSLTACGDDAGAAGSDAQPSEDGGADAELAAAACTATVDLLDYELSPAGLTLESGTVVLCARNRGKAPHDLALRDGEGAELGRTRTLNPGEDARLSMELSAGSYGIFCSLAGHESLGMRGMLIAR